MVETFEGCGDDEGLRRLQEAWQSAQQDKAPPTVPDELRAKITELETRVAVLSRRPSPIPPRDNSYQLAQLEERLAALELTIGRLPGRVFDRPRR